jgi:hypothetical protein
MPTERSIDRRSVAGSICKGGRGRSAAGDAPQSKRHDGGGEPVQLIRSRWEYKLTRLVVRGNASEVELYLNELGRGGWELVAVLSILNEAGQAEQHGVLKRPASSPKPRPRKGGVRGAIVFRGGRAS